MSGNVPPPLDQDASLFVWTGSSFAPMSLQYQLSFLHMFTSLFGFIANLLALIFLVLHKSLHKSPSTMIVMSMIFSDACLTLLFFVTNAGMLVLNSWWYATLGCGFIAFVTLFGCAFSILTLLSMTLERYYAIVKRRPWDNTQCYKAIAIVTFHALVTAIIPFLGQAATSTDLGYISRQPAGTYCAVAWWSKQPINIAYTFICAFEIVSCTNIMAFAYLKIYEKVRDVAKEQRDAIGGSAAPSVANKSLNRNESKSIRSMERMILIKSVVIVVTFFALWTPFDLSVLYMAFSNKAIPGVMDAVMVFMIQVQHGITPFIVIFMDSRCTKILQKYWRQVRGVQVDENAEQVLSRTEQLSSRVAAVNNNTAKRVPSLRAGNARL